MTERPQSQMLFIQTRELGDAPGTLSRQDEYLVRGICDAGVDLSEVIVAVPAPSSAAAPSVRFGGDAAMSAAEG